MARASWSLTALTALVAPALVLGGCADPAEPATGEVRLSGSIYTDAVIDVPCGTHQAPPELTGVELSFTDTTGMPIGRALTGAPAVMELPKGIGTEGWAHGGCRYFAPYAVALPVSDAYTVTFTPVAIDRPAGAGYFDGVNQLAPQTITAADLAAAQFVWNFLAPNSFVVH
jgi:hypothetical protein